MIIIRLFIFILAISCTSKNVVYNSSPQYSPTKDRFEDPNFPKEQKSIFDLLKWTLFTSKDKWPSWIELNTKPQLITPKIDQVNLTFINHSTFFLQTKDLNILTDPIWSERTSPVQWAGPKRVHKPGIEINKLGRVDIVIISHNHYDHLDTDTLSQLDKLYQPTFLVPLGDKILLESLGIKNVVELDWWENVDFNGHLITFTPNQHWSKRGLFDYNKSLWGGYVIQIGKKNIYFAGDTGYTKYFKDIFQRFGAMNLSLLPIGAFEPRWFMQDFHMDPEESIWAHKDLHSKKSVGIHFGTFQLTNEARDIPEKKLKMYLPSNQLSSDDFTTMTPGESRIFNL